MNLASDEDPKKQVAYDEQYGHHGYTVLPARKSIKEHQQHFWHQVDKEK